MTVQTLKLALSAIAAALVLAVVGTAGATPGLPSTTFDPASTRWLSLRDFSSTAFAQRFDELRSSMMVVDLDVDQIGSSYRVGAVFRDNPDGRGWASLRDLTGSQFADRWDDFKAKGYRLVDQESYIVGGTRLFAGVWVQNREHLGWASYRGVTSTEFSQKFDHYRDAGFLPVDVDVYSTSDGLRYAAVWVENSERLSWKLRRGLTDAQYADAFDDYRAEGLRSLVVDSVRTSDGQRYAGIFVENRNHRAWYAYRDLTANGFRNRWNQLADMGFRLDGYEKYDTASGPRYAGVWRQNSPRFDWKLRTNVDGKVQKHLDLYKVPGISVGVAYKGQLVYLRGFGYQDVADDILMHGNSVGRLASVSKAVAGVLAMRMEAKHPGFLAKPIRTFLPVPSHHSYTVAQSVMNRSCVVSYPSPFTDQNHTHYASAWLATKAVMAQPLGCTPGKYLYSTAAYTFFGAVLERLELKTIDQIMLDELTNRFDLPTLRPETTAGSLEDRMQLYNSADNSEYAGDDESNKTLGGGLVGSASDLTTFGMRILDGTILTKAQRTTMWTPIGSYGYGWDVDTVNSGERVVGKAGGQPGANTYLRIYPDDGIVISVLSNRWKGGHSAATLSEQIGELMLDELP